MAELTVEQFIKKILPWVRKYTKQYNFGVISVILAQGIIESHYGNSELAVNANNLFGLKYNLKKPHRCPGNIGYYIKEGSEQNPDGSYTQSTMLWQKFANYEQGVKGYFDFLNVANYAGIQSEKTPFNYILFLKEKGYATSLEYIQTILNCINEYNLLQYDDARGDVVAIDKNKPLKNKNSNLAYSPLVSYYREARHFGGERTHSIDTITIHCYVGQVTAKQGVDYFATTNVEASANYVVGHDGSVGCSVPENCRSFCSSNRDNDNRAITIEVASDKTKPYKVTNEALMKTIELVTDVCRRNKIYSLRWSDKKDERVNHMWGCNMTVHRDFKAKDCPGEYLMSQMKFIQDAVNLALNS